MSSYTEKPRLFSIVNLHKFIFLIQLYLFFIPFFKKPKLSVDKKLSADRKNSFSPRVTTEVQLYASAKELTRPETGKIYYRENRKIEK